MSNRNFSIFLFSLLLAFGVSAQNGARPGTQQDPTPPAQGAGTAADEGFEDLAALIAGDWDEVNTSDDAAGAVVPNWFQGNTTVFNAHAGPDDSYAGANFNSTGGSIISNWLLAPDVGFLQDAIFYTRTIAASGFPDRLQVRFSDVGGVNVGVDSTTVGDYDTLLEDINPTLDIGGYPEDWTEFTVSPGSSGRLAFRYFIDNDAGPVGTNSNFIGVDSVSFVLGTPLPPAPAVPTLGLFGLIALALVLVMGTVLVSRRRNV